MLTTVCFVKLLKEPRERKRSLVKKNEIKYHKPTLLSQPDEEESVINNKTKRKKTTNPLCLYTA